ncbi:MAG: efflux RND transporter periplasmic adaptor subunit [Bdellovibrionales bacterium]
MRLFKKSSLFVIVIVSLVAGILWQLKVNAPEHGRSKRLGTVKRGDLVQRVTVAGQVHPLRRANFVAPYTGYIRKLYVNIGQKVKEGAPVVAITSSLASPEPVFPIRAPFAGVIVDVQKTEGEYVTDKDAKDIIVRLDDQSKLFVICKAPELDAARIKTGMDVEIRVSALRAGTLKGKVRAIDLAAEQADGWRQQQSTFDVRVEVLEPPPELRSGQSAIVDIVTKRFEDVLYLGHEFINQEGDRYFVITRDGRRQDIEVGHQSEMAIEVRSGLKEGDQVEQIDFLKLLEKGA